MLEGINSSFLTVLASAAIESYSRGSFLEQYEHCVHELANEIDNFSKKTNPLDFLMYKFMARTVWPNMEDWKGKSAEDIFLQANLLAKDLRCFKEVSAEKREELMEVCLEMSRRITSGLHDSYYRISKLGLVA